MDPAEEKIIDLVEVVSEGQPFSLGRWREPPTERNRLARPDSRMGSKNRRAGSGGSGPFDPDVGCRKIWQQWARPAPAQEAEKAITREIEALKSAQA